MTFRDFVGLLRTAVPFASNAPVASTAEMAVQPLRRDAGVLRRFVDQGAWTKEVDRATHR